MNILFLRKENMEKKSKREEKVNKKMDKFVSCLEWNKYKRSRREKRNEFHYKDTFIPNNTFSQYKIKRWIRYFIIFSSLHSKSHQVKRDFVMRIPFLYFLSSLTFLIFQTMKLSLFSPTSFSSKSPKQRKHKCLQIIK